MATENRCDSRFTSAKGPEIGLRYVAILPMVLIGIFCAIWVHDRLGGGYQIGKLDGESPMCKDKLGAHISADERRSARMK